MSQASMSQTSTARCSFDLNNLGDSLDNTSKKSEKRATKEEIEELTEFIGGFEYWSLLKEKPRQEVVKCLDYKSRCSLGITSKADYNTVEETPIHIHSLEILDNERSACMFGDQKMDNVVVRIHFHSYGKRLELVFSQQGQDTLIQWYKYIPDQRGEKKQLVLNACNYYEEAVKFAEKWLKKCNYELNAIKVEMSKYPFAISQVNFLPRCKCVRIGANDLNSFNWWIHKVPEQLVDLQLLTDFEQRDTFTLPTEFLNSPQIMQVPEFYLWCRAAFTDEQLMNLKAESMSFNSVNITDQGINKFLENWADGKGVEGFRDALFWARTERDPETMLKGLDAKEWDEEFENYACGFVEDFERCCGRGTCYQIKSRVEPYESLTLSIHTERIGIYATGKKDDFGGPVCTYYAIP